MQTEEEEGSTQDGKMPGRKKQDSSVHIQNYRIISTLGRGSIGVTYKAQAEGSSVPVIVKTLKSISLHDSDGNEQVDFTADTWPVASLSHPNLVHILDVGFHDADIPFIVFEYIEGQSLDVIIRKKEALDPIRTLKYCRQVADALDYAHSFSITHGNLKPGNILITEADNAIVIDLGIAELSNESLTPVGTVFGTNSYLSPEQLHAQPLDRFSDIFSFGLIVFEVLTGMHAFPGTTFNSIVSSVMNKPPITFAEMGSSLPPELEPVLLKALAKEKSDRYSSCYEFIDAVEAILKPTQSFAPEVTRSESSDVDSGDTLMGNDLEAVIEEAGQISSSIEADLLFERASRPRTASGTLTNIARMVAADSLIDKPSRSSSDTLTDDPLLDASAYKVRNSQPTSFATPKSIQEEIELPPIKSFSDEPPEAAAPFDNATLFGAGSLTAALEQQTVLPDEEPELSSPPAVRVTDARAPGGSTVIKVLVLAIMAVAATIGVVITGQNGPEQIAAVPVVKKPVARKTIAPADEDQQALAKAPVENAAEEGVQIDFSSIPVADIPAFNDGQIAFLIRASKVPMDMRRIAITEAGQRELEGMIPIFAELLLDPNTGEELKLTVLDQFSRPFYLQYEEVIDAMIQSLDSPYFLVRGFSARLLSGVNLPFIRKALESRYEIESNEKIKLVMQKAIETLKVAPPYSPGV